MKGARRSARHSQRFPPTPYSSGNRSRPRWLARGTSGAPLEKRASPAGTITANTSRFGNGRRTAAGSSSQTAEMSVPLQTSLAIPRRLKTEQIGGETAAREQLVVCAVVHELPFL